MGANAKRIRGVHPTVQQMARSLRREMTPEERILWNALRGHQVAGLGFRRQHPVGKFILDFYAPSHLLVVELDGKWHDAQQEKDRERSAYLQSHGYRVLRFRNEEVRMNLSRVLEQIRQAALQSTTEMDAEGK